MLKKIIQILIVFWGLTIAASTLAITTTTTKKPIGPPYPQVWGYDLSTLPAMKYGATSISAHPMQDGDIWFLVTQSYTVKPSMESSEKCVNEKYLLIKFFKNEKITLSEKERIELFKIIDKDGDPTKYKYDQEFHFSDKSKFKFCSNNSGGKYFCPDFYEQYFLKTSPQGQESKHSILVAEPQVKMWVDGGAGDRSGAPFYYQKLRLIRNIIPLKDDTFVVFENGSSLILRFNKDFKTKFKPETPIRIQGTDVMRNFFVIDYSVIEDLEEKHLGSPGPFFQNLHDNLLSYFQEKYNK